MNMNCFKDPSEKRTDYISWGDYFMATAFLAAKRSKDPVTQVGACIVNSENRIVAVGYNGMPNGLSDDEFPWTKSNNEMHTKHMFVCHAEVNAVLNKNTSDVKGCTMYVGLFPCNECAKIIIQAGIKEIFYLSDKHAHKQKTEAAKAMFDAASIPYKKYIPSVDKITIDFFNDM